MSLYLAVFDEDGNDIEGVECGRYADFNAFRDAVVQYCCKSRWFGSRFPLLLNHSDSDGEWSAKEIDSLRKELQTIKTEFAKLPPIPIQGDWQTGVAKEVGLAPKNLFECFIDVDGEFLLDRLLHLCSVAAENGRPIKFQ